MARSDWRLNWFQIGAIEVLLTGTCGFEELILDLLMASNDRLNGIVIDQEVDKNTRLHQEPEIIKMIRAYANKGNYCWKEKSKKCEGEELPWPLDIKFRRMQGELSNDYNDYGDGLIITPDALIIPWPLPAWRKELRDRLEDKAEGAGISVPDLNENGQDYDPDRDIRLRSLFTVYDCVINDSTSSWYNDLVDAASDGESVKEILRKYERDGLVEKNGQRERLKDWKSFILPKSVIIEKNNDEDATKSYIGRENNSPLKWHIGLKHVMSRDPGARKILRNLYYYMCKDRGGRDIDCKPPTTLKDNPIKIQMEIHPIAAYKNSSSFCENVPVWQRVMNRRPEI